MYVVKHKNPKHPDILAGKEWAVDGVGENWTEHDAEQFALRAMYVARKIEFIIEEMNEEKASTNRKRKVHSVQSTADNAEGQEGSIESSGQ